MHCVTYLCTSLGALHHFDFPYLSGKHFIHNSEEKNIVIGKYNNGHPVTKTVQVGACEKLPYN
jgi:hypothetical protein